MEVSGHPNAPAAVLLGKNSGSHSVGAVYAGWLKETAC